MASSLSLQEGVNVWLSMNNEYLPAYISGVTSSELNFTSHYGGTYSCARSSITHENVVVMHESSIHGVQDMASLADLHESAILFNLHKRYQENKIYTYIGSILSAVNPYKFVDNVYGPDIMQQYMKRQLGDLPPHIYAIANEVYESMWRMGENQCVLISGESGAGKTESAKFIISFLSAMSQQSLVSTGKVLTHQDAAVEEAIVLSSPILEAIGNAKTVYNNNSSRFGKFIELNFSQRGFVTGGKIVDYLLEKNRVVRQNPGERNFHIFYCLLSGADEQLRDRLGLQDPSFFYYLSQTGCITDPTINDTADYTEVLRAFQVMEIGPDQVYDLFSILASILHIGNVSFVNAGGAQVSDKSVIDRVSRLLGLDSDQFSDCLTQRVMVLRGEQITTPLTIEQATDSRDSLSMALYANAFKWVLERINARIVGGEQFATVGILDIFGFENFSVNRFEQFNINFANEKLQEYFNKHIFSLEQHEYSKEGINWSDIEWVDNAECLDLIERKLGVLSLLDEESRFPKGTDKTLLEKLHNAHKENSYYIKPKVNVPKFGVRHYAGEVMYEVDGLLEKNRDNFRDDVLQILKDSRSDYVYDLFDHMQLKEQSGVGGAGGLGRRMSMKKKAGAKKKATVSSQFKDSLHALMTTLGHANPYFVRCIKPNMEKMADRYIPQVVLNQLRYSGMMETVRIRRAGFPVRRIFDDFLHRYHVLGRSMGIGKNDSKHGCHRILQKYDSEGKNWQLGMTKAFMREDLERMLERERDSALRVIYQIIFNCVLTVIQRKRYLRIRQRIIFVQKFVRRFLAMRHFFQVRQAIIVIQKWERGRQARCLYAELLEQKRIEEERRREEERRLEEERQRELERLEREQKEKEAEEMRRQFEEAERLKREEEEMRLKAEEESRQQALAKAKVLQEQRDKEKQEELRLIEEQKQHEEEERIAQEEVARREKAVQEQEAYEERARREAEEEVAALAEILELELEEMMVNKPDEPEWEEEPEEDLEEIVVTEEEDETRRKTFVETGSDLFWSGEELFVEGFLSMKHQGWKRRWCIIKEETFMFFHGKQEALKQGWLWKKGGGSGTLSRRSWKQRYFVMYPNRTLCYYERDAIEDATKYSGIVEIANVTDIIEEVTSREHSFGIVTPSKTFQLKANSAAEKKEWLELLKFVRSMSEKKIRSLMESEVDPRNAIGTIYLTDIEAVQAINNPKKPNAFAVITANRVYNFVADDPHVMHKWISALSPRKMSAFESQQREDWLEKGWLMKEGRIRRRRFFVLTEKGLTYYRSEDTNEASAGTITLNCLCSIDPLNETEFKESGYYTIRLHARRHIHELSTKNLDEANKWIIALQDAIDSSQPIQTLTERLILSLIKSRKPDWDKVYDAHPILAHTKVPIKAPLLALPYGKPNLPKEKYREYKNLHIEAVNIFTKLLSQGALTDPIPTAQSILGSCFDLQDLRSEVFCQLIKQTAIIKEADMDSQLVISAWQLLACMVCAFIPERAIQRYLTMHIKKTLLRYPGTEMAKFAQYCQLNMKRTKQREYPPSRNEIIACLGCREMVAVVYTYGDSECKITVNSATTAQDVVNNLMLGLGIRSSHNKFGLFEVCGEESRFIQGRSCVADLLAKFEKQKEMQQQQQGETVKKWRLFFKIHCFKSISAVPLDSIEGTFLFEQGCAQVLEGHFPTSEENLIKLGALRQQYLYSDYDPQEHSSISDVRQLYPWTKLMEEAETQKDFLGAKNITKTYESISRASKTWLGGTLSRLKGKEYSDEERSQEALTAKMGQVRSLILQQWQKLQGLPSEEAQKLYMDILQSWEGFGSIIHDVKYVLSDQRLPSDIWLAIGYTGVQIYEKNQSKAIRIIPYEEIESFGGPYLNKFKLVVVGEDAMLFETNKVNELAKLIKSYLSLVMVQRRGSVSSTV